MTVQSDFVGKAFDQAFDSFKKATESSLRMQQDMFQKWSAFSPAPPSWNEQSKQLHHEWTKATEEMTRKYQQAWDRQCKAGMESLESIFRLADTHDSTEFRLQLMNLWRKSFECLKELTETQMRDFEAWSDKWMEAARKAAP